MKAQPMWHPWNEMRRLQQEMERLFGDAAPSGRWSLTGEYPPINLTREDNAITLEALCPGVDRSTFDISVVGEAVTIKAQRKPPAEAAEEGYYRQERPTGAFTRTVALGERLDPDQTQASYTNGILSLRLARAPDAAPKKITIQS